MNYQHHQRIGARAEYRQLEGQRIKDSASLAAKFRQLKSLTVDLAYYNTEGLTKSSEIKYKVNLDNAKSVFRFDCLNKECVGGGFDLSELLAGAVAERRKALNGEMHCLGWRDKDSVKTLHCHNILRYKLNLAH